MPNIMRPVLALHPITPEAISSQRATQTAPMMMKASLPPMRSVSSRNLRTFDLLCLSDVFLSSVVAVGGVLFGLGGKT